MDGLPLYVSPQGSADYGEVAYCFNFNKHFPNERGSSKNKFSHYIKKEGTAANFIAMAQTPRVDTSLSDDAAQAEDFRAKVLRVLYNGYPRDNAGLKAKYNAEDWELRFATQNAVWYFTDSRSMNYDSTDSAAVINIYQELIKLAETTVLPDNFTLDIYEPQNVTDDKGYQNLLTTGIRYEPTPDTPKPPSRHEIKISKTEVGKTAQLPGASLKIVKGVSENGEEVISWTTTETLKTVSLEMGFYTLVETSAPTGYEVADPITFGVTADGNVKIKNGNDWITAENPNVHMEDKAVNPEKLAISVSKEWDDSNDQDGRRPGSITATLLANGAETDKTVVLSTVNQWTGTFTDLDKKDGEGNEITYTVKENSVDGYTSSVTGTAADGFVLKNSHTPEKMAVSGSKTWNDSNDNDGKRPDSITVRLHKDGQEIASKTVTENDNWSWDFTGLDKYRDRGTEVIYTITEDAVANYESKVTGSDVENKYSPGKTSIAVNKIWNDKDDQDGKRPDSVKINLYADGEKTDKSILLTKDGNWTGSFTDLAVYKDGKEIAYTVKEDAVDSYESKVTGSMEQGFTIENIHTPEKISVNGTKTWNDNGNQDGKRPDSITVRLHQDGQEIDAKTVTADDNWSWEFTDLDKYRDQGDEILYTITEDTAGEYTADIKGYDVENSYTPQKTSVTVTKHWNDSDDRDKLRPGSIKVTLYADGKATDKTMTLSKAENWTGAFTDLDQYKDGKEIEYTVKETSVEGYESVITGDAVKGYTISNIHNASPVKSAKTGDDTWIMLYTMLALAAMAGAVAVVTVRSRNRA